MTAYLEDVRHDEVAKSSWWKRSKKHAVKDFERTMMDEQRMFAMDDEYRREAAGMYRKQGKKGKRK
jgi:hypothetical protein